MNIHTAAQQFSVTRAGERERVADQFCGELTLMPNNTVLAKGFSHNTGHKHSKFDETYLVLQGELTLALLQPGDHGKVEEVHLSQYDSVRIPAGVGHKVVGGSDNNAVFVSCEPYFVPGDEVVVPELESAYDKQPLGLQGELPQVDRRALQAEL
jgi:oxalate decarboxylase/phosphoglucose isomerase-like protein (cupin superfamily)